MAHFSREYLSSNSLVPFPFEQGVPECVFRLFCDAVVSIPLGSSFSSFLEHVKVENGILSFDWTSSGTKDSIYVTPAGQPYSVVSHSTGSKLVVDFENVKSSEGILEDGPFDLSASCSDYEPGTVSSISLWNSEDGTSEPECTASGIRGDVLFVSGTNMEVSASASGITLEAQPGAGEGVVKCECPDPEVEPSGDRGTLKPDEFGAIVLSSDPCINISIPTDENGNSIGTILIEGRCTAPCPPSKYVYVLDKTKPINEDVSEARRTLLSTAEDYNESVEAFNDSLVNGSQREFVLSLTGTTPFTTNMAKTWVNDSVRGFHGGYSLSFVLENRSRVPATVTFHLESVKPGYYIRNFVMAPSAEVVANGESLEVRRSRYWTENEGDDTVDVEDFTLPSGSSISGTAFYYEKEASKYVVPGKEAMFHASSSIIAHGEEDRSFAVSAYTTIRT